MSTTEDNLKSFSSFYVISLKEYSSTKLSIDGTFLLFHIHGQNSMFVVAEQSDAVRSVKKGSRYVHAVSVATDHRFAWVSCQ
ncbi:hypothetical protein L3Y34_011956 [Caenorhabditis briggsae]|uniref:Uncharacterized protein n=1 Tax=Caenorhabditis briggsae TaxID=6238 RepID=A0AAE8ZMV2_CAEBR|nr:hypothetical protein L3Y34_011956 [Caenorhabditis briggsae]